MISTTELTTVYGLLNAPGLTTAARISMMTNLFGQLDPIKRDELPPLLGGLDLQARLLMSTIWHELHVNEILRQKYGDQAIKVTDLQGLPAKEFTQDDHGHYSALLPPDLIPPTVYNTGWGNRPFGARLYQTEEGIVYVGNRLETDRNILAAIENHTRRPLDRLERAQAATMIVDLMGLDHLVIHPKVGIDGNDKILHLSPYRENLIAWQNFIATFTTDATVPYIERERWPYLPWHPAYNTQTKKEFTKLFTPQASDDLHGLLLLEMLFDLDDFHGRNIDFILENGKIARIVTTDLKDSLPFSTTELVSRVHRMNTRENLAGLRWSQGRTANRISSIPLLMAVMTDLKVDIDKLKQIAQQARAKLDRNDLIARLSQYEIIDEQGDRIPGEAIADVVLSRLDPQWIDHIFAQPSGVLINGKATNASNLLDEIKLIATELTTNGSGHIADHQSQEFNKSMHYDVFSKSPSSNS